MSDASRTLLPSLRVTGYLVPKKIDRSGQIGDAGIVLIHRHANEMSYVWREKGKDAGIDGEIELRNPMTGEVTNRRLLVQSKASENRFPGETDRSFHYICKISDIDYWMQADLPVLLVCSHPAADQAWWVHVQPWFSDPAHRASHRVEFDKATQSVDRDAAQRLLDLADRQGRPRTEMPHSKPEILESNLLCVALPPLVYSASCAQDEDWEAHEVLRRADAHRPDWIRHNGRLYSFTDPVLYIFEVANLRGCRHNVHIHIHWAGLIRWGAWLRGILLLLAAFPDPGARRGVRHPIAVILALAVCAVLAGARSFVAITGWAADADQVTLTGLGSPAGCRTSPRSARPCRAWTLMPRMTRPEHGPSSAQLWRRAVGVRSRSTARHCAHPARPASPPGTCWPRLTTASSASCA